MDPVKKETAKKEKRVAVDGLNRLLVTIYLCRLHKPSAGSLQKSVANNEMNLFFFTLV